MIFNKENFLKGLFAIKSVTGNDEDINIRQIAKILLNTSYSGCYNYYWYNGVDLSYSRNTSLPTINSDNFLAILKGKEISLKVEYKVTPVQLRSIYGKSNCSEFDNEIEFLLKDNWLTPDNGIIILNSQYVEKQWNRCNDMQKKLLKSIGIDINDCPYYDGQPCLVKKSKVSWVLRYSNGKGMFYNDSRKSGNVTGWETHRPLDMNNLPINE